MTVVDDAEGVVFARSEEGDELIVRAKPEQARASRQAKNPWCSRLLKCGRFHADTPPKSLAHPAPVSEDPVTAL
jgi:hypothetical protein